MNDTRFLRGRVFSAAGCGADCPCRQPFYDPLYNRKLVFSTGAWSEYQELADGSFIQVSRDAQEGA